MILTDDLDQVRIQIVHDHPLLLVQLAFANSRLRPTDPVSQLLDIVHKIVYISYVSLIEFYVLTS